MRLEGECCLYPIPPLPEGKQMLIELLGRLRKGEMEGLNVTIPHKQTIIPYLDELTAAATAIGAVNTIFVKDGQLVGENTDAPGFLSDLERFLREVSSEIWSSSPLREHHVNEKSAILLGAGGAARAVAYALANAGWEVTIAARRLDQAQEIAANLQSNISTMKPTTTISLPSLQEIFCLRAVPLIRTSIINLKPKIIVNATPVGMWPDVNESPWPLEAPFPTVSLVYDLVYHPAETALMRAARLAGLPATNGLGMLIEQAALALEIWTGRPVPRKVLWEAATGYSGSHVV
jgi:shikimate dehydrogenase